MIRVTALASGSSGNAFLVETAGAPLLVEAGLSARALERLLRARGVEPATLAGIVVSHEHHDHAQGAGPLARRWQLPVICSPGTQQALAAELQGVAVLPLGSDGVSIADIDLWGFPVPHDAREPQGLLLESGGVRIGWALDLGHVPAHVPALLAEVDLAIIEANHDRERLLAAPYTWSIKQRILSEHGHLSNLQAAQLLAQIGRGARCQAAWLAHLSARANDQPQGVLRSIAAYLDMAGGRELRLAIAERDRPSAVWESEAYVQQMLF